MSVITVAGAGAFGTSLAIALAEDNRDVSLWGRNTTSMGKMAANRENAKFLPGISLPQSLNISCDPSVLEDADTILLCVPTQHLRAFAHDHRTTLVGKTCVLCCKGVEKDTGLLPTEILADVVATSRPAVLTGPGFASEIAAGLPTALTLALDTDDAPQLQGLLSTRSLRLYLSDDPIGAQLGGALKNVIAIACGIAMGAGLGESARAAVMTRGYAEILRLAVHLGGTPATLSGLSGLGDLALTCTSHQSRNFSLGFDLGKGGVMAVGKTYEGVATARATSVLSERHSIEMPLSRIVTTVLEGKLSISGAVDALLSRPLKSET